MYFHKGFLLWKKLFSKKPNNLCLVSKFNVHEFSDQHKTTQPKENFVSDKKLSFM